MGGFFPLAPTPLYTIAIICTDDIVFLVDCTNKDLLKKKTCNVPQGNISHKLKITSYKNSI
jgi:hypothetical protein